jgi:tetratricopeptide (TPR) repeat protein
VVLVGLVAVVAYLIVGKFSDKAGTTKGRINGPPPVDQPKPPETVAEVLAPVHILLAEKDAFDEAWKVLDDLPPRYAESGEKRLQELKKQWSTRIQTLGEEGSFHNAVKMLGQAHPTWADSRKKLLLDLQNRLLEQVKKLEDAGDLQTALKTIGKAPPQLVNDELRKRKEYLLTVPRDTQFAELIAQLQKAVNRQDFSEARQLLARAKPANAAQNLQVTVWRATIELEDPKAERTAVGDALKTAKDLLQPGKLATHDAERLCRALGKVHFEQHEDATLKQELDPATALLELACKLFPKNEDLAAQLKNLDACRHYFQAFSLLEVFSINWEAIVGELGRAFSAGGAEVITKVPGRLQKAAKLAVEAADNLRQKDVLIGNPFPDAGKAEHCCQLLKSIKEYGFTSLDQNEQRQCKINLALAALHSPKPDLQLAASLTEELANHTDDELRGDAIPIRYGYLKSRLPARAKPEQQLLNPGHQQVAIDQCTRLCKLLDKRLQDRDVSLPCEDAEALYKTILQPIHVLADHTPRDTNDDFYAAFGSFIWNCRDIFGLNQDETRTLVETLFSLAIERAPKSRDPGDLAAYYLTRGQARFAQRNRVLQPVPAGAGKVSQYKWTPVQAACFEAVITDANKAKQSKPDLHGAHGLLCEVYLHRASGQPTRPQMVADLTESIKTGGEARNNCPAGSKFLPVYLLNLHGACVYRANCDREHQEDDLKLARETAEEAIRSKYTKEWPDYPYLALGHAHEDLAYLAERDPEENYKRAVEAFVQAAGQKEFSAKAYCGIGRCYYRSVAYTRLDSAWVWQDATRVWQRKDRGQVMQECIRALQKAKDREPECAEAYYFLGMASTYQGDYETADEYYRKAKDLARQSNLPTSAVYVAYWAKLPLMCPNRRPEEERLHDALSRAEELFRVPLSPGGLPNWDKEKAWFEGQKFSHQASAAYRRSTELKAPQQKDEADKYFNAMKNALGAAKTAYSSGLPGELKLADRWDYVLLRARANCSGQLATAERPWNQRIAQAAIDDFARAAEVAFSHDDMAVARKEAAQACYEMYQHIHQVQFVDRAMVNLWQAVRLAPRRAADEEWYHDGEKWRMKQMDSIKDDQPDEKRKVIKALIDWLTDYMDTELKASVPPVQLTRAMQCLQDALKNGVSRCKELLNVQRDQRKREELRKEAMNWQQRRIEIKQRNLGSTPESLAELKKTLVDLENQLKGLNP